MKRNIFVDTREEVPPGAAITKGKGRMRLVNGRRIITIGKTRNRTINWTRNRTKESITRNRLVFKDDGKDIPPNATITKKGKQQYVNGHTVVTANQYRKSRLFFEDNPIEPVPLDAIITTEGKGRHLKRFANGRKVITVSQRINNRLVFEKDGTDVPLNATIVEKGKLQFVNGYKIMKARDFNKKKRLTSKNSNDDPASITKKNQKESKNNHEVNLSLTTNSDSNTSSLDNLATSQINFDGIIDLNDDNNTSDNTPPESAQLGFNILDLNGEQIALKLEEELPQTPEDGQKKVDKERLISDNYNTNQKHPRNNSPANNMSSNCLQPTVIAPPTMALNMGINNSMVDSSQFSSSHSHRHSQTLSSGQSSIIASTTNYSRSPHTSLFTSTTEGSTTPSTTPPQPSISISIEKINKAVQAANSAKITSSKSSNSSKKYRNKKQNRTDPQPQPLPSNVPQKRKQADISTNHSSSSFSEYPTKPQQPLKRSHVGMFFEKRTVLEKRRFTNPSSDNNNNACSNSSSSQNDGSHSPSSIMKK